VARLKKLEPGDLAWIRVREKGPAPLRAGASEPAEPLLRDGAAVTVIRKARASDYGDWWRKTNWGPGMTYAGKYSKVSWLVSDGTDLWIVLDRWLVKRITKEE
jgi:hypothetical protein